MRIGQLVFCAISLIVPLGLTGCYNEQEAITENQARASSIIIALDHYEQAYGAYPDTLDQLSPEFIDQIPLTVDGYEFEYSTHPAFEYELGFSLKTNPGCEYLPEYKIWECTSGVE